MTVEEMRIRKKELGYSNRDLAELSGVPLGTLQKIFSGATTAPRRAAIKALEKVLRPVYAPEYPSARSVMISPESITDTAGSPLTAPATILQEAAAAYEAKKEKQQGEYTLEDYYALPEERRVELIDGVIYDMTAPVNIHQAISHQVERQLDHFVEQNHGKCMIYHAPFDVQLDRDNRTMVQPDIAVICDRSKLRRFGCYGAPEMVVEILSPSTAQKDLLIKLNKYLKAGVQEYWLIHPEEKYVIVYVSAEEGLQLHIYSFQDQVPVYIWGREYKVDFARIYEEIAFLYELEK